MAVWINDFLAGYSHGFYYMQIFIIVCLFVLGVSVTTLLMPKEDASHALILTMAFPVGISVFVFVGFIMLLAGVPYKMSLISLLLVVIGVCSLFCAAAHHSFAAAGISVRRFVMSVILVAIGAGIVSSGSFPMSVSNDSLYYFWQYPRAIVYYEGLREQFDNFLTDTGVGAAIIGTLPFLYGFGETFGIQSFFNFNFILFFAKSVYDMLGKISNGMDKKKKILASAVAGCMVGMCTPVYILSHWAMANMYFMEMCFIVLALLFNYSGNHSYGKMTLIGTLVFTLSLLRMEGGIFAMLIAVVASILDYRGKDIAAFIIMPSAVLMGLYDIKIFMIYTIDNPYKFLTPQKALLQFAAFAALAVYVLFLRKKLIRKFGGNLSAVFVGAFAFLNIILLIYDHSHYIANLKAFMGNLLGQSGWGIFPYAGFGAILIIIVWELFIENAGYVRIKQLLDVKNSPTGFWLMSAMCFLLLSLAVSFARGDNLDVATGDSGNRVLLQIAPIVLMMFVAWFSELAVRTDTKDDGVIGKSKHYE